MAYKIFLNDGINMLIPIRRIPATMYVFQWTHSAMLLRKNAIYKYACVRCYQLYTIPRNALIPNMHGVYLLTLRNGTPWKE